jgi:hypothetical protein
MPPSPVAMPRKILEFLSAPAVFGLIGCGGKAAEPGSEGLRHRATRHLDNNGACVADYVLNKP